MWCVLRELNPTKDHPERVDKEKYFEYGRNRVSCEFERFEQV